jgi:uncharacterized membrane protein
MAVLLELVTLVLALAGFFVVQVNYGNLPERVPIHFGFSGRPDSWGARPTIWLLPALALVMYAVMTAAAVAADKPGEAAFVAVTKLEVMALFLVITWDQLKVALKVTDRLGAGVWILLAVTVLSPAVLGPMLAHAHHG